MVAYKKSKSIQETVKIPFIWISKNKIRIRNPFRKKSKISEYLQKALEDSAKMHKTAEEVHRKVENARTVYEDHAENYRKISYRIRNWIRVQVRSKW